MSQDKSKTRTTIKIAAKDASQRGSGGSADPGPGDPSAAPSEMPEPVSIPAPPSPSELVVKSGAGGSRVINTINNPVSLPKSKGSSASTALSGKMASPGASMSPSQAATTPKTLSSGKTKSHSSAGGSKQGSTMGSKGSSGKALSGSKMGSGSAGGSAGSKGPSGSGGASAGASGGPSGGSGGPSGSAGQEATGGSMGTVKTLKSAEGSMPSADASASQAMQADSQAGGSEQDVVEDGETEIEHPSASPSPSGSAQPPGSPASGGIDTTPVSSGGGSPKMSVRTSSHKPKQEPESEASSAASPSRHGHGKKKKKMTKFRYHKRVTVRTHGKTSPSAVMDKVNLKDHKAGITPSSIGEMDPVELMKRAGIKESNKAHWRVRLRQTKRTTKNGKTVTQTKVAYRDSDGNKRIKTSSTPDCQKCGKKLEECKCD